VIYNPTKQSVDAYKKNELHKRGLELLRLSAIIVGSAEPNEAETNICMVIRYTGNQLTTVSSKQLPAFKFTEVTRKQMLKREKRTYFAKLISMYRRNASLRLERLLPMSIKSILKVINL
jgi:hypothetical protein